MTGPDGRFTRRGLLAVAGSTALAGCGALRGIAGGDEATIETYYLPGVHRSSEPAVVASVPVEIGSDYLGGARGRIDELLARLPTPVGPDDVADRTVRYRLDDAASEARISQNEARNARTALTALRALRRGREQARYAAAGWAAADAGLTVEAARQERERAVTGAAAFRDRREYVGADPVRAALVHARVDELLTQAVDEDAVDPSRHDETALVAAEWGRAAEATRTRAADARHLQEQFAASVPDDAGTVEPTLTAAAEELVAAVTSRAESLPVESTPVDPAPIVEAANPFRWAVKGWAKRTDEATPPAGTVVEATRLLAQARASERLRKRAEAGETGRVESMEAIAALREDAHEALQSALDESPSTALARTVVAVAARRVAEGDSRLASHDGAVPVSALDSTVREYIAGRALARAAPRAVERAVDALPSN